MKNLILMFSLVIMSVAHSAENSIGGTLENRKTGETIEFRCTIGYDDNCQEIGAYYGDSQYEPYLIRTYKTQELDARELARETRRASWRELNNDYVGVGLVGTAVGVVVCAFGEACILPITLGVAVDIVKAPVVIVGFVPHKISDMVTFNRIKTRINFLLNPEKVGKTKKMRNRDFNALLKNLRFN